jgi:hypothetical protein
LGQLNDTGAVARRASDPNGKQISNSDYIRAMPAFTAPVMEWRRRDRVFLPAIASFGPTAHSNATHVSRQMTPAERSAFGKGCR